MSDEKPVSPNRKMGRPRSVVTLAQKLQQRRLNSVREKVRTADAELLGLLREWLAGHLGVTAADLESRLLWQAIRAFLKDNPHRAGELVAFHRNEGEPA